MEAQLDLPEEGELVYATVTQITPHGVYVTLDEYDGMKGFLHISEISTGWVRNISRFVQEKQKLILKVIRVNKVRREVDLSLRQVTEEERRAKILQIKRFEKARIVFNTVKMRLNLTQEDATKYEEAILEKYDDLYTALETILTKGEKAFEGLNLPAEYIATLKQVAKEKITLPTVSIKGVIEAKSLSPNGIEIIKEALEEAEKVKSSGAVVNITYLAASKYLITVTAENYKIAERTLEAALNKAKNILQKNKAFFSFSRG
ncbi:MAG: translation initiation factor IF-2 subunit alpha [Nitrososphaerales archaeon]